MQKNEGKTNSQTSHLYWIFAPNNSLFLGQTADFDWHPSHSILHFSFQFSSESSLKNSLLHQRKVCIVIVIRCAARRIVGELSHESFLCRQYLTLVTNIFYLSDGRCDHFSNSPLCHYNVSRFVTRNLGRWKWCKNWFLLFHFDFLLFKLFSHFV